MDILWLTNIILPEFAEALGRRKLNQGGWLPSLVEGLRVHAPELKLTVLCETSARQEATVGGVRYVGLPRGRLRDYLKENAFDLVHIHGTEGRWAAMPNGTWAGSRVVASLQGILNGYYPHYTGGLLPREVRSVRNWPNFLLTRYGVFRGGDAWRTRLSKGERRAFRSVGAFLGRTEWDAAWTRYLAPNARYFHVGEILRAPFYRGGRAATDVVLHRIYCGAAMTYPLKGGHWLVRAVAALKRKYPDVRLRVANAQKALPPRGLLGAVRQGEYHRYLCRLMRELGVQGNIDLLPSLTAEQVADELRRAEVFVLPSLCENSPNSLGEAMLMGCPAIATDVGGTKSILKDGEQGSLVPSGDPAALAFEIDRFFSNPTLARGCADAAQADALKRYDPKTVVEQLVAAYREVSR